MTWNVPYAAYNDKMARRINASLRAAIILACISPFASAGLSAQEANQTPTSPALRINVDSVLVPVVVKDGEGQAIGNLKKEDFQVFDRGRLQEISGFTVEQRVSAKSIPGDANPPIASTSGAAAPSESPSPDAAGPPHCTVLLFDDMHLNEGDLMRAKTVGEKLLAAPLNKREAVAVVSMSGSNSGLTQNSAKLRAAVAALSVKNLYRHNGQSCPDISYYEADLIRNKHDPAAVENAIANYLSCSNSIGLTHDIAQRAVEGAATHELELGDQDARVSLSLIRDLVLRMRSLPGRRTLVLVSPGFLSITPESMAAKSIILDRAAQSNVTINTLDARGLYSTEIDASDRGARSSLELLNGSAAEHHRETLQLAENVLGELANGTGGTYFHNNNDLLGGMQQLMAGPEYLYVLEFSLRSVKRDESYHPLTVKVNRAGVTVQARSGYFAPRARNKDK